MKQPYSYQRWDVNALIFTTVLTLQWRLTALAPTAYLVPQIYYASEEIPELWFKKTTTNKQKNSKGGEENIK